MSDYFTGKEVLVAMAFGAMGGMIAGGIVESFRDLRPVQRTTPTGSVYYSGSGIDTGCTRAIESIGNGCPRGFTYDAKADVIWCKP